MNDLGAEMRSYIDNLSSPISREEIAAHGPVVYSPTPAGHLRWLAAAAVFALLVAAGASVALDRPTEPPQGVIDDPQAVLENAFEETFAGSSFTVAQELRDVEDGRCSVWKIGSVSTDDRAGTYAVEMFQGEAAFTVFHAGDRVIIPSSAIPRAWGHLAEWIELDRTRDSAAYDVIQQWNDGWLEPVPSSDLRASPVWRVLSMSVESMEVVGQERVSDTVTTRYRVTLDPARVASSASELRDVELDDADADVAIWIDDVGRVRRLVMSERSSGDPSAPMEQRGGWTFEFSGFGETIELPAEEDIVAFSAIGISDPAENLGHPADPSATSPC